MTHPSETIRKRYSCRSYDPKPVEMPVLQRLMEAVSTPQVGPFGNRPRFHLMSMDNLSREDWKDLGTYGVIKNARLFLAGAISPAPMALEDYGFCKEKLILKATELGLNTCWLGGTFAKSAFERAACLNPNELLPTVAAVGYAAKQKSLTDRLMRGIAGSTSRLPWGKLFFSGNPQTSLSPEEAGPFQEALENVRRAPSASNRQPWRIVYQKDSKTFLFYLSRTAGYRYLCSVSLQDIDMGIAMSHFDLTMSALNLPGRWRINAAAPPIRSWEYIAEWQPEF